MSLLDGLALCTEESERLSRNLTGCRCRTRRRSKSKMRSRWNRVAR